MHKRLLVAFVVLIATVCAEANAQEKFGYKGWIPGETTRDAWFTQSRYTEGAGCPGHVSSGSCMYAEEVICYKSPAPKVDVCGNGRENAIFTFYDGVLALIDAEPPIGGDITADLIHDQLVAKYGKPTKVESMPYRNNLGANIPSNRYIWEVPGYRLSFDEIGNDLQHAKLFVIDSNRYAQVEKLTVKSQI